MTQQVEETGLTDYQKMQVEAKELGIKGNLPKAELEKAIEEAKKPGPTGITLKEAKDIEARLRFEEETRGKIRKERQIATDRAELIADSESSGIPIDLSDNPTELELAKARRVLGVKKREVKPSPETLGIEAGKRGYYIFTNREQEDASHTVNLGGKYVIHLIPDQVHVLSDYHIKKWASIAVTPVYDRVPTGIVAGPKTTGRAAEVCKKTGSKRRFAFEYLGDAPIDAPFGLVTDSEILKELEVTI